jgi:hypothetical protein
MMPDWKRITGVVLGLSAAGLLAGAVPSCSSSSALAGLDQGCSINSDCDSPLICAFGRCHTACNESRDCGAGERCVQSSAGAVCELPDESSCSSTSTCATGLVCATDDQCRAPCVTAAQCADGQSCVTSGTISACYDPGEIDGGVIGGEGGGGPGADGGPDATLGGGDDGSTPPEGDAACVSLTADGGCNSCAPGICGGGGNCINGNHDYTCSCFSGYVNSGTKTCVVADSCSADDNCPANYPCANVSAPGQACLGEFALWPMPDNDPSAKVAPRYADNGDGTVTDEVTTLVWQGQLPNPSNDCTPDDGGTTCTLPEAQAYCASLNLGGKTGWRLPTKIELESLLDCTQEVVPTIANAFNNSKYSTPTSGNAQYFWAASPYEQGANYWLVNFDSCGDYAGNRSTEGDISVRCVNGTGISPGTAASHYTVNAGALGDAGVLDGGSSDTVSDNWTGLTWQRGFASSLSPTDGATYCAALGGGFRLPTFKELLTLVDPAHFSPAISPIFPGTPNGYFDSSSIVEPPNNNGYYVLFTDGSTLASTIAGNLNYVRCVK